MTIFKRITASPEVLVKIATPLCIGCPVRGCQLHNHGSYDCQEKFLRWLNSEVEE